MKRIVAIILIVSVLLCMPLISAFSAEEGTISMEDFFRQVNELILNYELSGGLGSGDIENYQTNRLIVKTETNDPLKDYYGVWGKVEGYDGMHILQYANGEKAEYAYKQLSKDEIEYVEYDFYIQIEDSELDGQATGVSVLSANNHLSWNSDAVDVDEAIGYIESQEKECNDVTVAIVDSGIYADHNYFNKSNRIIDSEYIYEAWEQDDDLNYILVKYSSMEDGLFHGTHIAGTVFDNTMENVKIMPFRATNSGSVLYSDLIFAFKATMDKKPNIINISTYKLPYNDEDHLESEEDQWITLYNLITQAINENITIVVCAGNKKWEASRYYPACHPDVITVASSDENNRPDYERSNKGAVVDVAAPGTNIRSTSPRPKEYKPENPISEYLTDSGTSYAAALVSAAAATLKSIHPEYTPADIQRIIKETAYVPDGWDTDYGVGIVNFLNMVKAEVTEVKPTIALKNGKIEITAPEGSDSRIYYTLDGTVPTIDNPLTYTSPLDIGGMNVSTITAVCHENGKLIGEPVTFGTSLRGADINLHYKYSANPMPKETSLKADWRSSNPNVASVDCKGNITGVSPGTTYVYAIRADGMKMTYKVTVDYALWQEILIKLFFGFLWYI